MNEKMNIKRESGELFAIEILKEGSHETIITLAYENDLNADMIDIIRTLAKRGYIIKILYHYNSLDKE